MKVTENFVGVVEQLRYAKFEKKKITNEDEEKEIYICNLVISEVGRGLSKFKQKHNVVLYLNEEQYNQIDEDSGAKNFIEKGDRIEIFAGAKWQSQELDYKSYDSNKIKNADKSQIKIDTKGKSYWHIKCYAYKIVCKSQETWKIKSKWYEQNYCTIFKTRVKLPLLQKTDFTKKEKIDFYLENFEMHLLKQFNGQTVRVIAYSNGNKFAEKEMLVYLNRQDEENLNYLLLSEVASETI